MAGHVKAPISAWVAVLLMIVGFSVCTGAFIAGLHWLLFVGAGLGLVGVIIGKVTHMMEHAH